MLDMELKSRARRVIEGRFTGSDLDRLYLGLREDAKNAFCFRDIGDFIAHRDERGRGITTETGRDVYTSVSVWSMKLRGLEPSLADVKRAGEANLRLMSDEQIKASFDCGRQTATTRLGKALAKIERGSELKASEREALNKLGNRFVWRPAFDAHRLCAEFGSVLAEQQLIKASETSILAHHQANLSLHALAAMHGSRIVVGDGNSIELFAGFSNRMSVLEVKARFVFHELGKPLIFPVCLFLTNLTPSMHCEAELVSGATQSMFDDWKAPIEIGTAGRLQYIK